jgi:hypothetical protein
LVDYAQKAVIASAAKQSSSLLSMSGLLRRKQHSSQ